MGKNGYVKVAVRKETAEMLEDCKENYLEHHPEMQHVKITKDKILFEVTKFYLR